MKTAKGGRGAWSPRAAILGWCLSLRSYDPRSNTLFAPKIEDIPRSRRIEVLAIGALNVDYIADLDVDLGARVLVQSQCPQLRWHSETCIEQQQFSAIKRLLADKICGFRLGGSAFNALRTLRICSPQARLGFCGAFGPVDGEIDFAKWFSSHGIDTSFVGKGVSTSSGGCLALEHGGERTLLTTRGANDLAKAEIARFFGASAAAIAPPSIIHASSFLDVETASELLKGLEVLRAKNPTLEFSIDPGANWSERYRSDASVRSLIDAATLIFVNLEEFDRIWGCVEPTLASLSRRIGLGVGPPMAKILLKLPGSLTLFDPHGNILGMHEHRKLEPAEIIASTGAGDVVAGAYIATLLSPNPKIHKSLAFASALASGSLRGVPLQVVLDSHAK